MAWQIGSPMPEALANATVRTRGGEAVRLGDELRGQSVLLVFLRHYGCTGCSQQVDALAPHMSRIHDAGVKIVLIGNGQPEHLIAFERRQRLEGYPYVALTDPELEAYRAAGLERSAWAVFGPRALAREIVVRTMGYQSHELEGDVLQQGGVALVDAEGVLRFFATPPVAAEPIPAERIVDAAMRLVTEQVATTSSAIV
ncbi:MAG: peroxiredoxin-like family protein [Polyangiaceae bacterium]